ncbi:MAG TPA: formate dehydrogenase accessory protein FdhE [Actinophytocola sp.]|jgi:FdhE protein|uniref:formate dehydrogenase accessory protein FdhE domain-containing protein n=1 Tax=Actinophytocola sp. TaxID=1872138 RepID=UPI002DF7F75E|nr:formate dehydrogenase accessory protein FdhE [Actinophytocola sp.]
MAAPRVETTPWAASRRRAETLCERHDFAAEPLTLYLALLEVWEESWDAARADQPDDLAAWAADRVLPQVVAATRECGPDALKAAFGTLNALKAAFRALLAAYLAGEELVAVERYLARATLRGPLAAVDAEQACAADPAPRGDRRCPRCAGPPQLSFRTDSGDNLVSGHRKLQCARCGASWSYSSSACAYCGETAGAKRTVYSEQGPGPQVGRGAGGDATFPHLRIEACAGCQRYLIDVDLGRDPRAVPEVDELAALPLDLHAAEQGLSKITPNLMGF